MNLWALLAEGTGDPATEPAKQSFFSQYGVFIILAVVVVLLIVWFVFSGRKNKSRQKEYVEQLEAIRPGNKVKSAGGLCGIVVEVCDDNTVIIETGSETAGKSYFKLDKESIYQTDAKGPTQLAREQAEAAKLAQKAGTPAPAAAPEEAPSKEPAAAEEAPAEEIPQAAEEAPAEEIPQAADETPAEETDDKAE